MKILWHSNAPFVGTGYGQQTAMFAPRIRDAGHDLAISAFYGVEGATLEWGGIKLYPTDHTNFGGIMLPFYVGHWAKEDPACDPREVLVITLADCWPLIKHAMKFRDLRLASWCPVDHEPCPPLVLKFLSESGSVPIAMSRFGERQLDEAGLSPLYVPHGVETSLFKPIDEQSAIRESLGVPEDAFVVGMVANNKGKTPSRKSFETMFQAFKAFHDKHDDAVLYLHADVFGFDYGLNLNRLAAAVGIPDTALALTDQLNMHLGVPQEQMPFVFNGFDVLAMPSMGEGFGIPLIEAQACGVPVIASNWTAMPELVGAGWLVDGDPFWDGNQEAWWMKPAVSEIVDALEQAYEARGDEAMVIKARAFAEAYDADRVFVEHWLPALDALDKPREVAPLRAPVKRAKVKAGLA